MGFSCPVSKLLRFAVVILQVLIALINVSSAQTEQSEIVGVAGDGNSLQATVLNEQAAYVHINLPAGLLKFAMQTSNGWSEETLASV